MPKFTFVCEHQDHHGCSDSKTTLEFEKEGLFEVVEEFERFLKGSGYVFSGQLEFVEDELISSNSINPLTVDQINEYLSEMDQEITPDSAVWPFPANERPQ